MKHLIVITIISIVVFGCNSGNRQAEPNSGDEGITNNSIGEMESVPENNTAEAEYASPSGSENKLDDLRMGMTEAEVIETLGEPTNRETIGNDKKTKAEDWWYGENKKVRMINGKVNFVVRDVARQKELLQQLLTAKKNGDEDAVKRIMNELTIGQR